MDPVTELNADSASLQQIAIKFHKPASASSQASTSSHSSPTTTSPSGEMHPSHKIVNQIRTCLDKLYAKHLSSDGKAFRYTIQNDVDFKDYLSAVSQLKEIDLSLFTEDERKAFFVNIYNGLVIHHLILNPTSTNTWPRRLKFYGNTCYNIGGHSYSLNDIEHGILRSNHRLPCWFFRQLPKNDPRAQFRIHQMDPRIHFAINCGAKSCAPIRLYDASKIDEQLNRATKALLSDETHFHLNVEKKCITLNPLFWLLQKDFGENKYEAVKWCLPYIAVEKKQIVDEWMQSHTKFSVKFSDYDWDLNAME